MTIKLFDGTTDDDCNVWVVTMLLLVNVQQQVWAKQRIAMDQEFLHAQNAVKSFEFAIDKLWSRRCFCSYEVFPLQFLIITDKVTLFFSIVFGLLLLSAVSFAWLLTTSWNYVCLQLVGRTCWLVVRFVISWAYVLIGCAVLRYYIDHFQFERVVASAVCKLMFLKLHS